MYDLGVQRYDRLARAQCDLNGRTVHYYTCPRVSTHRAPRLEAWRPVMWWSHGTLVSVQLLRSPPLRRRHYHRV